MKVAFAWDGHVCAVEAPRAVAEEMRALFPALARPAASDTRPDVVVARAEGGFRVSPSDQDVWPTLPDAVAAAELAVTRALLASDGARCHLHAAAALAEGGLAVLAVGPSGSGKSSLAYAWYRLGRPLFGDDVVPLDAGGRVHAFPRPLKVDDERLRWAGEAPEDTVGWDPEAPDVWVDPEGRAGWAPGGAAVGVLAEVRFVEGASTRVEALDGGQALRALLDAVHATGASREASLDRLLRVAEGCPAYRVAYGNSNEAAHRLLELADDREC